MKVASTQAGSANREAVLLRHLSDGLQESQDQRESSEELYRPRAAPARSRRLEAGITFFVPVSDVVAIGARPIITGGDGASTLDVGTRLEVQLRSPVYANLLRVYVGAGPQGFYEIDGPERHHTDFSGGWDIGAAIFIGRNLGVHWEMGTSGGSVSGGAGPVFTVGFRAYH